MSKTYYLSVKYKDLLGDCGNCGPNPCVKGMKENFGYGKNGYVCVKCGQYLYNVQEDLFVEKVKKLCK